MVSQVRADIRKEYGLPPTPTSEEQQRCYEIGTADVFRVVAPDEVAYHSLFLKVIQRGKAVVMAATTSVQGLRISNMRRLSLLPEFRSQVERSSIARFFYGLPRNYLFAYGCTTSYAVSVTQGHRRTRSAATHRCNRKASSESV